MYIQIHISIPDSLIRAETTLTFSNRNQQIISFVILSWAMLALSISKTSFASEALS